MTGVPTLELPHVIVLDLDIVLTVVAGIAGAIIGYILATSLGVAPALAIIALFGLPLLLEV